MTTTSEVAGVRNITAERAAVEAMSEGLLRDAMQFDLDVLEHIRAMQRVRDTGLSAQCNMIDGLVEGVANPARPYLTWECCVHHKALKMERERLDARAKELGRDKLTYDTQMVIED